jgi:hypothetical protein
MLYRFPTDGEVRSLASRARLACPEPAVAGRRELATLRLTAEMIENLSALSGVAYTKFGAILASVAAPNSAPRLASGETLLSREGANENCEHALESAFLQATEKSLRPPSLSSIRVCLQ